MISRKPDIDIQKDGRVILRGRAYDKMKAKLRELANQTCELCDTKIYSGDVHHLNGKGGGRRDDRIFVGGKRNLLYICRLCHEGEHVPKKVIPAKPTEQQFNELLGL